VEPVLSLKNAAQYAYDAFLPFFPKVAEVANEVPPSATTTITPTPSVTAEIASGGVQADVVEDGTPSSSGTPVVTAADHSAPAEAPNQTPSHDAAAASSAVPSVGPSTDAQTSSPAASQTGSASASARNSDAGSSAVSEVSQIPDESGVE
jgi:hypothetical protein